MKPVKNFLFTTVLVSAMAVNTMAGVEDTPGKQDPPPPPQPQMTPNTEDTGGITIDTADYLFLEVLTALLSVY
jgi:hypothetical protein